jgi:hypothetical protein
VRQAAGIPACALSTTGRSILRRTAHSKRLSPWVPVLSRFKRCWLWILDHNLLPMIKNRVEILQEMKGTTMEMTNSHRSWERDSLLVARIGGIERCFLDLAGPFRTLRPPFLRQNYCRWVYGMHQESSQSRGRRCFGERDVAMPWCLLFEVLWKCRSVLKSHVEIIVDWRAWYVPWILPRFLRAAGPANKQMTFVYSKNNCKF